MTNTVGKTIRDMALAGTAAVLLAATAGSPACAQDGAPAPAPAPVEFYGLISVKP